VEGQEAQGHAHARQFARYKYQDCGAGHQIHTPPLEFALRTQFSNTPLLASQMGAVCGNRSRLSFDLPLQLTNSI
jgi:hypothetical protein